MLVLKEKQEALAEKYEQEPAGASFQLLAGPDDQRALVDLPQGETDHEIFEAYEDLRRTDPLLAKVLLLERDSLTRGNEAVVGRLSEQACQSPVIQEKIISWLIDHPDQITALVRDWPDRDEVEQLLQTQPDDYESFLQQFLPNSIVVKFVKPESGLWDPEWGLRAKDATCLFQTELENGWYLYLQEELEMCFELPLLSNGYEYVDGAANQQCGYDRFGQLRLADYGAVGHIGTGDAVLQNPLEVADSFDTATSRDDDLGQGISDNNYTFEPYLEGQFDSDIELLIAEDLLLVWNGDSVTKDDIEQEIHILTLTTEHEEDAARALVLSVHKQLQDLREQLLISI